ncbi:ferlin, putative [Plasmodium relictum]|uniref:Ferlin, putative n=1 Tax=Plasmodium relictum TaxID=85471 RepID=A0A1J1H8R7_PLARL|nr:ferlin, putative [Plasmodium relictum]CRH01369.1 ferlin, putative [Plasmodium relictum]
MRIISVGFTIYEAQNLEVHDKFLLDPLVIVRCCNNEYITKKKKKKYNAVNWEESHIWDRIVLSEIEWNVAKIEFEVQSANTFWRNETIGVISFELKLIKNKKNHQIQGIYPIYNKNGTEIRGQLRLKVMVCDEKDYVINDNILNDLVEKNDNNISDNDELYADLSKAVVEENITPLRDKNSRFYYLYVNIHKIEDIYVDINKKNYRDLYITCEFNGCHLKSSQGRNCTNYTFNECFKIPISTPILEDSIVIKIWDWNFLSNDELLAIGVLSFTQIKNKSINPTWFNLYGFHKNEMNLENEMNDIIYNDFSVSLEGNFYLGRICISSYVERLNNFDNLNVAITQSCLAYDEPLSIPITLLCDVYLVTGILAENIYVQLCCGPYKKKTDYVNANEIKNSEKKKKNNDKKYSSKKEKEFFNLFNFDDLLNLENFFNKISEKQNIIENNENTEFYFSSRKGKIENMKLCVVSDELQQWDIIINVYEKSKSYNTSFFNNFLNNDGNYASIGNEESKLTDYQKYKKRKYEIEQYEQQTYNNDRRIAYYRMPLKNVLLHNEKISRCPIWIPLKNIPKNVDGDFNCMYNILQNGSILINLEKSYDVQLGVNKRKNLIPVNYELRCYIYACRNIISNFNDSPNTFVHISCSGKMKITSLVLNNSNPVFLQCLKLNINILTDYSVGLPTIPLIIVTLYEFHNNTFYFIGRCFCNYDVYLKDNYKKYNFTNRGSTYNVVEQINPRWIKLKGSKHVKAMYPNNLWQQYGTDKRIIQENLYEKQKEIYNNKENMFQYNDLLCGERVGDILLYFELVQSKDAVKIPIYPMISEIKKCSLSFYCMSLENLVLMKKQNYLEMLLNKSVIKSIAHPVIVLSITSYSSYGKKKNELLIKYEKCLKANTRIQLKSWKNSFNQQSFEMFSIEKMDIDIPLDPIFDPTLNIKVYNKKIKEKYFIGETNISLVPYIPWIKNIDEVIHYLQAHDDYSETINFKNIDGAFNIYKNKNAALVITAISLADCEHTINLKEELNKYEEDDDDMWKQIPLFNMRKEKQNNIDNGKGIPNEQTTLNNNYLENKNNMYNNMIQNNIYNYDKMMDNNMYNSNVNRNNININNKIMKNDIYNNMIVNNIYNNNIIANDMDAQKMYSDNMINSNLINNNMYYDNNMMINNMYKNNIYNPSNYGMINYNNNYPNNIQNFPYNDVNIGNNSYNNPSNMYNNNPYNKYYNNFSSYYEAYKKDVYNVKFNDNVYKLFDDGVPEIIKLTYNVKNYPYIKILTSKFILNVHIPPRFIIYVEGDKLNTEKFIKNFHRSSVDGILENYLDDILIPSIPLKKKCSTFSLDHNIAENKIQKEGISFGCFEKFPFMEFCGGYIKCFAKIKYRNLISENIPLSLKDIDSQNVFRNKFRGINKIPLYLKIRVYVLRGIGIYGINNEYLANPYLIFSLGEKTSNLRNSFKECNINPEFRCLWESEAIFPEDETLTISVYSAENNFDKQINDIYIGSTEINLFDRWMSKEWRHMMKKNKIPIEYRPLYNNYLKGKNDNIYNKINSWNNIFSFFDIFTHLMKYSTRKGYSKEDQTFLKNSERNNYGILEMWVEIMDYEQSKKIPIHKMASPKKTEIEIRIIIWRCTILSNEENGNRTLDLIVTSELDCPTYNGKNANIQSTDVHYNCKLGNAIFNWRIVYPNITHPLNTCFVQLAAYNNNNVGVSEFLGEVNLELSKYVHKASQIMNKFELDAELKLRKKNGIETENNYNGYIQVTVQFIPQAKANIKPVGLGRDEPNRNPYLRTPDSGREWNDFISSIGFNDIYKPFWNWLKIFFICLLIIWVFVLSFIYPSLLL